MSTGYIKLIGDEWGRERRHSQFASDVLTGLSRKQKSIPCKYFYDEEGSRLFTEIMALPEYYLTNCEQEILEKHSADIGNSVGCNGLNVVELGAGDGTKTSILLKSLCTEHSVTYAPIDISEDALRELTSRLAGSMENLECKGLVAEYFTGIRWLSRQNHHKSIVLFLGSNIGNLDPPQAKDFFASLWDALNDGDYLLTGFDLQKDVHVMSRAYDDSSGVTSKFNLNLLKRINYELGGNFKLDNYQFYSKWDPLASAIQSFLVSTTDQIVNIAELKRTFEFKKWERIHTESSYKFAPENIEQMASDIGFEIVANYYDPNRYFIDSLWRVRKDKKGQGR
jgi:dimethylhistidine N-methyltransferase